MSEQPPKDDDRLPPPKPTGDDAAGPSPSGEIPFASPGEDAAEHEDAFEEWDKDDPRRQKDQMAPPAEPCECYCLHCGRTFMSDQIWFQKVIGSKDGFDGFWMCPTPNCGGAGFTFDIFPTDPEHPANAGWHYDDDEEDDEDDGEWDEESGAFLPPGDSVDEEKEYDPEEAKYKELDELYGEEADDDDLEGEEWKYGLQPGERPDPPMSEEMRLRQEEEEKKYDLPDERPRELDWTNREEEPRPPGKPFSDFDDDDIPF